MTLQVLTVYTRGNQWCMEENRPEYHQIVITLRKHRFCCSCFFSSRIKNHTFKRLVTKDLVMLPCLYTTFRMLKRNRHLELWWITLVVFRLVWFGLWFLFVMLVGFVWFGFVVGLSVCLFVFLLNSNIQLSEVGFFLPQTRRPLLCASDQGLMKVMESSE